MAEILNISDIQLFNLLKNKLSEKEAEQFVSFVSEVIKKVGEKQQIITKDIDIIREEMRNEFSKTATKDFVESKIADAKFQIIPWAFVFWVTQLGSIFAFLKFFIK